MPTTTTEQFDNIPLTLLIASLTNPRKNFREGPLLELADSIKSTGGVHQPILIRTIPIDRIETTSQLSPRPTHEIVAGERRFRASKMAGMTTIPALIRTLTDDQALEIQIIENLQRDDLTDLEAAEGYRELMHHNSLSAEDVGKKIGKSRTYIYNSLKLLALPQPAQEALRNDQITTSSALLIARIPDIGLQQKALEYAIKPDDNGDLPSYRNFSGWLHGNVMLNLGNAPFPIAVKTLTSAGSCEDCDKRTGANPDLFTDVKSADMCTYPPCYHIKVAAQKDVLAAQIAAIPKTTNKNIDDQRGLGLESTLAQDARANQSAAKTADRLKSDIEAIKANLNADIAKATRLAVFDHLTDMMKTMTAQASEALLGAHLMRAWLLKLVQWEDNDDVALMLDMPIQEEYDAEFAETCTRRVDAATDGELYVFAATYLLIEERNTHRVNAHKPATLMEGFAKDWKIDLRPIMDEVREAAEAELKAKIAALNKQIKATKTTSTPPPAGAAIDDAAADAKKQKPAALPRKAKTTAQEAISGIAAAMQGIETEPLDASLGGSEAAAVQSGVLAVGAKVKVLDGKHLDKQGSITKEIGNEMWNVELLSSVGLPFAVFLPTKSLQVIA
jgi:ParB/RepB/Spo0J family partition protein